MWPLSGSERDKQSGFLPQYFPGAASAAASQRQHGWHGHSNQKPRGTKGTSTSIIIFYFFCHVPFGVTYSQRCNIIENMFSLVMCCECRFPKITSLFVPLVATKFLKVIIIQGFRVVLVLLKGSSK